MFAFIVFPGVVFYLNFTSLMICFAVLYTYTMGKLEFKGTAYCVVSGHMTSWVIIPNSWQLGLGSEKFTIFGLKIKQVFNSFK